MRSADAHGPAFDASVGPASGDGHAAGPLAGLPGRLLSLRTRAGLSQAAFAARLGFPKRTYISWEQGHAEPPLKLVAAVERELGVDPSWLLSGPGGEPRLREQPFDWQRLGRLLGEVATLVERHHRVFAPEGLLELAAAIFEEPVVDEARLLSLLDRSFKVGGRAP